MTKKFFRKADSPLHVPDSGPGAAEAPSREIYAAMGEDNIKAMLVVYPDGRDGFISILQDADVGLWLQLVKGRVELQVAHLAIGLASSSILSMPE